MPSLNKVTVMGHLGHDASIKYTDAGTCVAELSVATTYKQKEKEPVTEWHNVVVFGKQAEWCAEMNKGNLAYVEGRLQTNKWEDKDGNKKSKTQIIAYTVFNLSYKKPKDEDPPPPTDREDDAPF